MSGPTTTDFEFAPFGVITLALREAQEMGREYQEVFEEMKCRTQELAEARQASQLARIEERKVLRSRALQAETQLARLRGLLAGVEAQADVRFEHALRDETHPPLDRSADDWRQHITAVQAEAARIQAFIRQHNVPVQLTDAGQTPQEVVPIEEALHIYMMHRTMQTQLDPAQSEGLRQMVARILARLDLETGEPVPVNLDHLAQAIVLAPDLARAESLSMELRLHVQRHCSDRALQRSGAEEARNFLAAMADEAPQTLLQILENIAAGEQLMDAQIRELARTTLQTLDAERKKLQEEAAAQVLGQALRDLGYDVEGVAHTFFMEGGVAHFQRHGWDEYFVRMRVGVEDRTLNFNVVRAKGAQESSERRRMDTMAEDRWCSEFPKLLETLAARGIALNVKRLLGAGELPVQEVDASTLPAATSTGQHSSTRKPQELKR